MSSQKLSLPLLAPTSRWPSGAYLAVNWLLDAALLLLGFGAAALLRISEGWMPLLQPLAWAPGAGWQYGICGAAVFCMLLYENVYGSGFESLNLTDRLVKALTGGLAASMLLSFLIHNGLVISRLLLLNWYLINLVLFALLRPLLRFHLAKLAKHSLTIAVAGQEAELWIANLRRSSVPLDLHEFDISAAPRASVLMTTMCAQAGALSGLGAMESRYANLALVPTGPELTTLGAQALNAYGMQILLLSHPLARPVNRFLKRAADLAGAAVLLLFTAPLQLAIAAAILIDSGSPVLYRQSRLGRNGRPIRILKFRTMTRDADARLGDLLASTPILQSEFSGNFKLKQDPRITRVGKLLRSLSLDELPQLWNALRGEMSLVGPRPIVEAEKYLYGDSYGIVATVRPGLTGIWQTSGRNDISYSMRKHFDVWYVRSWSPWLDLAVLVRTLSVLLLPNGY